MVEIKFDPSKISDFELAMISAEVNCCYHRIEQLSEILNNIWGSQRILGSRKNTFSKAKMSMDNYPGQTSISYHGRATKPNKRRNQTRQHGFSPTLKALKRYSQP